MMITIMVVPGVVTPGMVMVAHGVAILVMATEAIRVMAGEAIRVMSAGDSPCLRKQKPAPKAGFCHYGASIEILTVSLIMEA